MLRVHDACMIVMIITRAFRECKLRQATELLPVDDW